jgi:hypothetical protein
VGVAVKRGQFPVKADGFLGGGQSLGPPARRAEVEREANHRRGEVRQVGVTVERD